ncbi:MAG: ubiquitin-like protein UBact [Chthonomonadaceae bacterium]|jgi:hypothetical protein|nr:ubiquitin-like protein UBact [Chthonomonadaceae bacterium]
MILQSDRQLRRDTGEPRHSSPGDDGPSKPDVTRPGLPDELLKRMKKVDPDQAKKYRQRSGQ